MHLAVKKQPPESQTETEIVDKVPKTVALVKKPEARTRPHLLTVIFSCPRSCAQGGRSQKEL